MTETEEVKRALAALADGADAPRPSAVVAEAEAALADARRAAAFVSEGGLDRLRAAVEAADAEGDGATARRGAAALGAVERYRRAATGRRDDDGGSRNPFREGGPMTGR